ncbi:MAG: hypothetical protein ACREDT_16775 [Methylocella sp.]
MDRLRYMTTSEDCAAYSLGSYFRQFWDVRSYIDSEGLTADPLREKLYGIPEPHRWPPTLNLGDDNNRASADEIGKEEVVLVIRGELRKKYPTAVNFAQHAKWAMKDGKIDPTQSHSLDELTPADEQNPPQTKIRGSALRGKSGSGHLFSWRRGNPARIPAMIPDGFL